jgi:hypothetical protein
VTQALLDGEAKRLCLLAALLLPLREIDVTQSGGKAAKQAKTMAAYLIRESLKRRVKDGDVVDALHKVPLPPTLHSKHEHSGS